MGVKRILLERIFGIGLLAIILSIGFYFFPTKTNTIFQTIHIPTLTPIPGPQFSSYHLPTIAKKDYYTIAMVGDSMTAALGVHGGKLSEQLNAMFQSTSGHQRILIDNYAQGATNILQMNDQMTKKITTGDVTLDPLLSRHVDMILIESYGYNPLSQFPRAEGLQKQTDALQKIMTTLTNHYPNTAIIFVATIAPNKETYALEEKTGALSDRIAEAEERSTFIQNHMNFAKTHNIPLIDIYDASLTPDGDGNILYISQTDHIHPSFAGIDFINNEIAHFIYDSHILPE
ncbi:MAG TPA: SGNH/GDSL hydrolase family protein [Candidatus Eisenbacteria bacterium]|nr:SGNH/GDSL hydrolase family protein [Candidatus Eisenbacteria bacterium]